MTTTMTRVDAVPGTGPSTDTHDMALRMCRAERQVEALTGLVLILLETATPEARLRAATLMGVLPPARG